MELLDGGGVGQISSFSLHQTFLYLNMHRFCEKLFHSFVFWVQSGKFSAHLAKHLRFSTGFYRGTVRVLYEWLVAMMTPVVVAMSHDQCGLNTILLLQSAQKCHICAIYYYKLCNNKRLVG